MSGRYRIQVKEQVGPAVGALLPGFIVTNLPEGGAMLTGLIKDQAALRGLIQQVFDLGLTLISVTPAE